MKIKGKSQQMIDMNSDGGVGGGAGGVAGSPLPAIVN